MNLRETINRLLEDMDTVRPIVIAAMPDDMELRATTRRMVAELEAIKQAPAVPLSTYIWLSQLTSKLLDAEHGALLKPVADGNIPDAARQSVKAHIEVRQSLLMQAMQDIPSTQMLLDLSCERIGQKAEATTPLVKRAQHLDKLLRNHLQDDTALKDELQQLIAAFAPSMATISSLLKQVGEDSPELNAARQILEHDLPENIGEARSLLRQASQNILQAGNTLASASKKLNTTIEQQVKKLSTLSTRLQQAESEARNDPLTGLANRRRLAEFLKQMEHSSFCFLIIDIDFFKKINDAYGHDVGDEVLQQLAIILKESIRDTDLAARIGGEEFCIVFPDTNIDISVSLADKLRQSIATHGFHTHSGNIDVTISIGVSEHTDNMSHSDTFKAADQALYQSKKHGRNRVSRA
jgi:diguanylate cyclase (GGDEF)-like protein